MDNQDTSDKKPSPSPPPPTNVTNVAQEVDAKGEDLKQMKKDSKVSRSASRGVLPVDVSFTSSSRGEISTNSEKADVARVSRPFASQSSTSNTVTADMKELKQMKKDSKTMGPRSGSSSTGSNSLHPMDVSSTSSSRGVAPTNKSDAARVSRSLAPSAIPSTSSSRGSISTTINKPRGVESSGSYISDPGDTPGAVRVSAHQELRLSSHHSLLRSSVTAGGSSVMSFSGDSVSMSPEMMEEEQYDEETGNISSNDEELETPTEEEQDTVKQPDMVVEMGTLVEAEIAGDFEEELEAARRLGREEAIKEKQAGRSKVNDIELVAKAEELDEMEVEFQEKESKRRGKWFYCCVVFIAFHVVGGIAVGFILLSK
eukprot:scaffold6469_cov112-Cylindrotheca_fusiformis.AAC.1